MRAASHVPCLTDPVTPRATTHLFHPPLPTPRPPSVLSPQPIPVRAHRPRPSHRPRTHVREPHTRPAPSTTDRRGLARVRVRQTIPPMTAKIRSVTFVGKHMMAAAHNLSAAQGPGSPWWPPSQRGKNMLARVGFGEAILSLTRERCSGPRRRVTRRSLFL